MSKLPEDTPLVESFARRLPIGQVSRYLIVGVWNTAFGYGLFALFTYLLTGLIPLHPYIAAMTASILSNVIAITVAFLGYKWFVFKTKGNYLREYFRCYLVYGAAFLANLALLPVVIAVLRLTLGPRAGVPYIAGAILTVGTVLISFIGHRQFSFVTSKS
jgi:putative flippase GtrA